jgi:hypothetical protein
LATAKPAESKVEANEPNVNARVFVSGVAAAVDETYITVKVNGTDRCALLDTGCSRSCIARKFVPRVPLEPSDEQLYAANGTTISNLGACTMRFKVRSLELQARLQVLNQLNELILGYDWLRENHCCWDFDAKILLIQGQQFCLSSRPCRRFIRKIYVAESVTVEPYCQIIIPVKLAVHSVRTPDADWLVDSSKY